jgi:hypothetical protein
VIVLKGWALVPLVYDGDPSQRPSEDIDLLVKPRDMSRVTDVLYNLNYRDGSIEPWPGYYRRFKNCCHYLSSETYLDSALAFNIDLHWGFPDEPYNDRRFDDESIFERSRPIKISGVEVNSLATEDYLIYASVHMAHHGYCDSLSRYYEIAALILKAGSTLDWETVITNAPSWGVTIPLRRMINDLGKLWPGIIPHEVQDLLMKEKPSWIERSIFWSLMNIHNNKEKEAINILLSYLHTPGQFWRLRYILETAFPGPTYLNHYFGPAPGNLWPLLYFRRFYQFLHG